MGLVYMLSVIDGWVAMVFGFVPPILRLFTLSLIVLTIGTICNHLEAGAWRLVKWGSYVLYSVYTLYNLGLITTLISLQHSNIFDDLGLIVGGIITPIALFYFGKKVASLRLRGFSVFNFHTLWNVYLVLCLAWALLFPSEISFAMCVFIYAVSYITTYYLKQNKKGGEKIYHVRERA